jgi:glycerol kinase
MKESGTVLRVDGGMTASDFAMQFLADILGAPVDRPVVRETTALGAAYLAGLAVGYWKSVDDVSGQWKVDRRFEPAMGRGEAASLRGRWSEALGRSKGWEKPAG